MPEESGEIENVIDDIKEITHETTLSVERVISTIDAWFIKHFHNGPASQQEHIVNILHTAKQDLKEQISKL